MSSAPATNIPRDLIEEFSKGNGSIFIGAGISMGAGLPSWAELVESLKSEIEGCPEPSSFPDIAQYYENANKRQSLIRRLKALLGKSQDPTEAHQILATLPVTRFFTTNIDTLLETAFRAVGRPFDPVLNPVHLLFLDSSTPHIIKLHGDITSVETIVITADDYERYFYKRSAIARILTTELQQRTILFMGYSFNDDDLRRILAQVKHDLPEGFAPNIFTLQIDPPLAKIKDLDRRGMRVLPLKAGPGPDGATQAMIHWLRAFRACLPPMPADPHSHHNIERQPANFVGREAYLKRVLEGLRNDYALIVIKGPSGVGKTRLAAKIGEDFALSRDQAIQGVPPFRYVVMISAKANPEQKHWLNDLLNQIARTTHHDAISQEKSIDDKKEAIYDLLRAHRTLLIVDNYETIDDPDLTAWLRQIPKPSQAITTARQTNLESAWIVNLRGLSQKNSAELLPKIAAEIGLDTPVTDESFSKLPAITGGNPLGMRIALGLINRGIDIEDITSHFAGTAPNQIIDEEFKQLFVWAKEVLSDHAKQILSVTPLFVGTGSIRREALQATSGLPLAAFESGLTQCIESGLLEKYDKGQFFIHLTTRAFVRKYLDEPSAEAEGRRRFGQYYLSFIGSNVVRSAPALPYWNALVSDKMTRIDPEWPNIKELMDWACQDGAERDEFLVDLVMLLVHYMDSRFYNTERLSYVKHAVAVLERTGRKAEEALLRIDALGWTYVEECDLPEAEEQIRSGLSIADTLQEEEKNDLCALGRAWQARIEIEREDQKDWKKAKQLIESAQSINCQPWIKFRVSMAAGDIHLEQKDYEKALFYFSEAAKEAKDYEGEYYQITPRIGLALLGLGQVDAAEQEFQDMMREFEQIAIAKLYARYGLAIVAHERGDTDRAAKLFEEVEEELSRRTKTNLLLRLIQEQKRRFTGLQARPTAQARGNQASRLLGPGFKLPI